MMVTDPQAPSGAPEPIPASGNTPRSSTFRRWALAVVVLAVVAVGGRLIQRSVLSASAAKGSARPQATPVAIGEARRADVPVYLEGLGTATAFKTVTVRTRVDGQLDRVAFREGQEVRAGELLAEIDPRPFQVQLAQAEGTFTHDTAQLDNARLDLDRYRMLFAQDAIPKQQLDAQAATVAQLQGSLQVDQAAIDSARLQLTYCRITAPISGRVGLRLVDPGNMVHAADPGGIVVLTQVRPMTVVFTLPEDDVSRVLTGTEHAAPLPVTAFDRNGARSLATGQLLTADNEIDPTTGTFRLKAVFDNVNNELFPNQFVNIRLLIATRAGSVVVPASAVQRGQQGAFLFAVKPDHTVELRPVTLGVVLGDDVEIASGLTAGESVVVDGADRLQNGARVEPQAAGASGGASPPRKKSA